MLSVVDVVDANLCHGCGACEYYCPSHVIEMRNYLGTGYRPFVNDQGTCADCSKCLDVCSGITLDVEIKDTRFFGASNDQKSWGPFLEIHEGYSNNEDERYRGSSGGVGTAIGKYVLEKGIASGVLHIKKNENDPFTSQPTLSLDPSSVSMGAGSRYNPVSLCSGLNAVDSIEGKVVIIGKPCEIAAINAIRKLRKDLDSKILLTVSIFCGGTPSSNGSRQLCENLKVDPNTVEDIRYRGHGWPGNFSIKATGTTKRKELSYQLAWDKELTKHVPFRCSICPDGTGEFADISIGDPWYREKKSEFDGSSLVVVRTREGLNLFNSMISDEVVSSSELTIKHLYESQRGLMRRKQHVFIKIFWLRIFGLDYPKFGTYKLFQKYLELDLSRILKTIYTTAKWIYALKKLQVKSNRPEKL